MLREIGTQKIETERLILRKFTPGDAEGMYHNWATDYETCKTLSWSVHENKDVTLSVINNWIQQYENPFYYNWVAEIKDTREIIGNISVVKCKPKDEVCEIGYCYGSKYWGKGYASEALRAVIEFLINDVGFRLIEAKHISENPASGRVMEKAGMKRDAVLRSRRINKYTKNVNDLIVYSVVKDEL
jgi:ribosomal-protein-alanine N-acetyltransferase